MGLKPAVHPRLVIQALQETAEGKVDRFAARLSQINLRLDIVPAVVFEPGPPATASRVRGTSWPPATRPGSPPLRPGLLLGGYLNPASLALHATLTLASKGRLIR